MTQFRPRYASVCALVLFVCGSLSLPASARSGVGIIEFNDRAAFQAAIDGETYIDFESLTPSSALAGTEFLAQGVTITQLDGQNLNVVSAPPLSDDYRVAVFGSGTNVISSSYSDHEQPGYAPAPCCNVWFRNQNSDNIRFTFPDGASAAGFFFGENDVDGIAIRVLDTEGMELLYKVFDSNAPYKGFFGVCSDVAIGSIELVEPANDIDGLVIDDLVFAPVADEPPPPDDDTPPTINLGDESICLWPPNHKYQAFAVSDFVASVVDVESPDLGVDDVVITSISSDEAQDAPGNGDGKTLDDIVIAPDCRSFVVRAERAGDGDGRVYTINLAVTDGGGNTTTATVYVRVPHDQRGDGCDATLTPEAGYTVTSNCGGV
jgi:hypothetical protein